MNTATPTEIITADAPQAVADLDDPDSVFIGGYDDECHMGTMGAAGPNDLCAAATGEQGSSFQIGTPTGVKAAM